MKMYTATDVLPVFAESVPGFRQRWHEDVDEEERDALYVGMASLAAYVAEALDKPNQVVLRAVIESTNSILGGCDEDALGLIAVGLFEGIQGLSVESFPGIADSFYERLDAQAKRLWDDL